MTKGPVGAGPDRLGDDRDQLALVTGVLRKEKQ